MDLIAREIRNICSITKSSDHFLGAFLKVFSKKKVNCARTASTKVDERSNSCRICGSCLVEDIISQSVVKDYLGAVRSKLEGPFHE